MAGHGRSNNGAASLAYSRSSTSCSDCAKDVDARDKRGHDEKDGVA